jgi:hypothetical protein
MPFIEELCPGDSRVLVILDAWALASGAQDRIYNHDMAIRHR